MCTRQKKGSLNFCDIESFENFPKNKPIFFIYNVHFLKIVPRFLSKEGQSLSSKTKIGSKPNKYMCNQIKNFCLVFGLMFMINNASCDHIIDQWRTFDFMPSNPF